MNAEEMLAWAEALQRRNEFESKEAEAKNRDAFELEERRAWDRYAVAAFRVALDDKESDTSPDQWAALWADNMLAERRKRFPGVK